MVNPLDAMAWVIGANAVILAIAALKLPYKASKGSVDEEAKNQRIGYSLALGAGGLFLVLNGLFIMWSGTFADHYTVMFGGVATLGGLVVFAGALALYLNISLSVISYFAGIIGAYVATAAYAILDYGLTRNPNLATLGYLSAAGALVFSIPAVHVEGKWARVLFAIFALLFAVAWLYQGFEFTHGHMDPS